MGLITAGMGVVFKHIKKPGKIITTAGDKWHAKTMKLQRSKKKSERIRGSMRIIAPMTVAGTVGAISGAREGTKERRKRGVYGVERKRIRAKSLYKDIKKVIKKVKGK